MKTIIGLFITIFSLVIMTAYSAPMYRSLFPLTATITPDDTIEVTYNFSGKGGIRCISDHNKAKISFSYKGRTKSNDLPITLQNHPLPKNEHEELADVKGRFIISVNDTAFKQAQKISCQFIK